MRLSRLACLLILLTCGFLLSGAGQSAEQPTIIENPESTPVPPKKSAEASNPQAESDSKQKAAAEELARQKEFAAKELEYRRETDQRQIKIQERISDFTGSLVIVGFFQVAIAAIALTAIWVSNKAANAATEAAVAAIDANRIAGETLIITRRARIRIDKVHIFTMKNVPAVTFDLINFGELPATGVLTYPTVLPTRLGDLEPNRNRLESHRGPNSEGSAEIIERDAPKPNYWNLTGPYEPGKNAILGEDWEGIFNGEIPIHLVIRVSYWNGFHQTRITESWHAFNTQTQHWERIGMYQD